MTPEEWAEEQLREIRVAAEPQGRWERDVKTTVRFLLAELDRVTRERDAALDEVERWKTRFNVNMEGADRREADALARVEEYKREVERRDEYLAGADARDKEALAQVEKLTAAAGLALRSLYGHKSFWAAETRYEQRSALQDREAIDALVALRIKEAKGWDYEDAERRIAEAALAATAPKGEEG